MPRRVPCQICERHDRAAIEFAFASGVGRRRLGKRHRVSPDAIARHMKNHVNADERAQLERFAALAVAVPASAPPPEPGILTYYKQMTGMVAPAPPGRVMISVPADWCTTFYGRDGTRYDLQPGQAATVSRDDVAALTRLGCAVVIQEGVTQ